jgi:hypothetical protein
VIALGGAFFSIDLMRCFVVATLITMSGAASAAVGPNWIIEPDASGCTVYQRETDSQDRLEISRFPSTDAVAVLIADARLKVGEFTLLPAVTIALEPGGSRSGDGRLLRDTDQRPAAMWALISDPSFLAEFSRANTVTLSSKSIHVTRNIRSPIEATKALSDCEDVKMRAWGVSPAYLRNMRVRPKPIRPLIRLFSTADYPPGYLLNGISGQVVVWLKVGRDGKVQDCVGLNRGVDRFFLKTVCDKLRRYAVFEPAIELQGNSVAAPYVTAVGFGIER